MAEAVAEQPKVVEKKADKLPPLPPIKIGAKKFNIKSADDKEPVLLAFDEVPISRGKDKETGESKRGQTYLAPLNESLNNIVSTWGEEKIMDVFVRPRMKLLFQNLMNEATDDETGEFDEAEFIKLVGELSARGETIQELLARQFELADEMSQFDVANPEHIPILLRIARQIKATSDGIRQKKRKTKADKEAEASASAAVAA